MQINEKGIPRGTSIIAREGVILLGTRQGIWRSGDLGETWIEASDGLMHSICDAGIVFSPGGDFIVTIYRWNKNQILFDPANQQMADLAQVVYQFFNPIQP